MDLAHITAAACDNKAHAKDSYKSPAGLNWSTADKPTAAAHVHDNKAHVRA
jgi:hypothetical protein